MVGKEEWGPVYCLAGPHKGRVGYSDDDEIDDTRFDWCMEQIDEDEG